MNKYKLLKKLRDAGYKQSIFSYNNICPCADLPRGCTYICSHENNLEDKEKYFVYNPPLEELIENCGDDLWSLTKHGNIWQTNFKDGIPGETAHENIYIAVANFWLKNKNK